MLALLLLQAALAGPPCEDVVCVEVEKTSEAVTFYAVSRAENVSISFSASAVNMEPSAPSLILMALHRGRTELLKLKAIPGKTPSWEQGYIWEWGAIGATHDDRVRYRLPFESGRTARLQQGPNGAQSHQGDFAFDFPMPPGTPVCAARAGTVIEVVDRFGEGGNDIRLKPLANRVLVLHDDGTIGAYLHLQRGGMRVRPGDHVDTGTVIAASGNSGFTSGPHLHFEVFRRLDTERKETLPIKFHTADGDGVELEEGKSYRAE